MPWSSSWTAIPGRGSPAAGCSALDGTLRASPFRFPGIINAFDSGLRLGIVSKLLSPWALEPPKPKRPTRVDWVSGASMILRRTMLEEIGLLDEGLYTYFDDVDIGIRAKRAGWETWYVTESPVVHLGGSSTGVTAQIGQATPGLLVPGPATVLPEELREGLHRPDRRRIDHRIRSLAAETMDPAQAGYRSRAHARRPHPIQRLRLGVRPDRGREPGEGGGRIGAGERGAGPRQPLIPGPPRRGAASRCDRDRVRMTGAGKRPGARRVAIRAPDD